MSNSNVDIAKIVDALTPHLVSIGWTPPPEKGMLDCRLCGGKAYTSEGPGFVMIAGQTKSLHVGCNNCKARSGFASTQEEAVKLWNDFQSAFDPKEDSKISEPLCESPATLHVVSSNKKFPCVMGQMCLSGDMLETRCTTSLEALKKGWNRNQNADWICPACVKNQNK